MEKTDVDSLFYCTVYYPNGNIKSEGLCINKTYPHGRTIEYYNDGEVKWVGEFIRGQRVVSNHIDSIKTWNKKPWKLYTSSDVRHIRPGDSICFRVTVQDVHPEFYIVTICDTNRACQEVPYSVEHEGDFPYTIKLTPDVIHYDGDRPYLDIAVFFEDENGTIIVPRSKYSRTFIWEGEGPNRVF